LPTAFHHDYQDNLRLNSTAFLWKIQGLTRTIYANASRDHRMFFFARS